MLRFLITIFLANGCLLSPLLANIEYLIAFKEQVYSQEGNNTPTGPMLWYFNAGVSGDAQVTGGTVTYPGSGGAVVLTGSDGTYTTDGDDFPTREAMDAVFPNGDISLSIVDNGETLDFGPFNLSGDTYPPAPHFLNLQEFRDHNFSQDFLLRWDAFAGAGPNDKVIIQIFDPELEELLVFEVLPGDTTSFNIPGGIFSEFFSYEMELFFLKATDALEVPETLIGYISSNYTSFDPGFSGGGGVVNIPDQAVKDAVKLALDLFPEDDVTEEAMGTLNSLQVTSDVPVDLTGLEFAYGLIELTLNSEEVTSFLPILDLIDLEEVKLVAPQKPDLFFTHWSDGSQENPRIIELTGQQDFGLTAQYSNVPLSPFAGGYAYIVNGTVATALSLPAGLNVNVGDPYELRLNYLILEDAMSGDGDSSVALIYDKGRLAMEVEVRIKNYRWILRSTNEGSGNASIYSTALDGIEIFEFNLTDSDGSTESEFPFSNGNETISFTIRTNLNTGKLFNGSLKIPDDPGYVNWSDITSGTGNLMSGNPNWLITLSTLPGPNQSYRIEKLPSYLDLSRSIAGYATNRPTAEVERSTDYLNIYWNDPYYPNFETTYEVWRGTSSNLSSARMVADELVEPAYGDSDVLPGKAYFYWIRAIRDGLKADFSLPVSNFRAVAYPEDVQATQGDFADRIRVSWARVSGATSYTIYRDVTEDFDTAEMLAEGITGNEYEDYTPDSDDPYFYWVVSEAFGVYSEFSNSARGYRVANGINTVRASDGLYSDYVRITWEAFPEATTYTVYRNSANDIGSAAILAEGISDPLYDDMLGPENQGVTYFYWVRPVVGGQIGSFSNADPGYIPVQRNSSLLAWGDNDFDQTNLPDTSMLDIVQIAAGANHSLALTSTGTVIGWGRDEYGQATPPFGLTDVIDIAVGYDHSLALLGDGTVIGWGRDNFGKTYPPYDLENVIDIEAGADHSLALLADGNVVGWGGNDYGQIDVPDTLTQVVQISAGGYHNLARRADGSVVAWGDNSFGQLNIPGYITEVIGISAGWYHSLVLLPGGFVDGWGDNSRGQLDFPADVQDNILQAKGFLIRGPVSAQIVDISGGLFHSLALSAKGELAAWGEDKNSQTETPANLGVISQIDAGDEFNLVLAESDEPRIESLIPGDAALLAGEDLVLKVRATGGPDIAFQWFFNNQPIENAIGDSLFLSGVSPDQKGSYSVAVTSNGKEITSTPIQLDVTLNPATVTTQTIRALKSYDGTYLFSEVETNPPGLKLSIRSPSELVLPSTTGTHLVSVEVDQVGYGSVPLENVTLILDTLDNKPLRLLDSGGGLTIQFFAPEGFKSSLQMSANLRDWVILARVATGDGSFHDFNFTAPSDNFYRVVFELP